MDHEFAFLVLGDGAANLDGFALDFRLYGSLAITSADDLPSPGGGGRNVLIFSHIFLSVTREVGLPSSGAWAKMKVLYMAEPPLLWLFIYTT